MTSHSFLAVTILAACTVTTGCGSSDPEPDASVDAFVFDGECPGNLNNCLFEHGGWNFWCSGGTVYLDDLYAEHFCAPGSEDPVCVVGGPGDEMVMHTCSTSCADEDAATWVEEDSMPDDWWTTYDFSALCAASG